MKLIVEEATKLVPSTVSVKLTPPARAEVGEVSIVVGTGLLIAKVWAEDVPPPGAGVTTVTKAVPAVAMSVAGTTAATSPVEMKVVMSGTPFQYMTEDVEKSEPSAVNVNCGPPAVAKVGLIEVRMGVVLKTVNVWLFEVPPPGVGLVTVTGYVPGVAMSDELIIAVS